MGYGVSRMATVLACMLLGGCASEAPRRYSNPDYAYEVRLPSGLRIDTSTPPNPNHGFRARVPPPANVWVTADYETENVYTLAEEVERVREIWRECRIAERKTATLGGTPATALTLQCPATSRAGRPETVKLLLTMRTPPDHGVIVYTVGLQQPWGSHTAEAERIYRALVDGLSFTRG